MYFLYDCSELYELNNMGDNGSDISLFFWKNDL